MSKERMPKKVKDAIIDICDDVEAMLGAAIEPDESGDFDTLNKRRIKIIRKYIKDISHE